MKTLLLPLMRATACALFLAGSGLSAATIDWTASGSGNWSLGTNWSGGTAPGASDTATITGTSGNQTVTYDSAASGQLGTLNLDEADAGFVNTLDIAKTGNSTTPSLTVANDVTIGGDAALGTATLQLGNGNTSSYYLQIGSSGTGNLTIGANGVLYTTGNANGPTIAANVILQSGGTLTLNNSGNNQDTRTIILGNFTATGGTIARTGSNANQGLLQLQGAINVINDVTFSSAGASVAGDPYIYLNSTGNQSLTTNVTINNLAFRGSSGVKTLSETGNGTIGTLYLGNYTASTQLTFQLGSNLISNKGFQTSNWAVSTGGTLTLDTNGYNLTVANTLSFVVDANNVLDWNVTNSSATASTISASNFTFTTNATSNTISGNVTLQATGTGSDTFASATFGSGVRFLYTGSSASFSSTNAMSVIEVGDGVNASTLSRSGSSLAVTGGIKINANSTYNSNGQGTSLSSGASITGDGTYHAVNTTGNVTWAAGATGGLSAGLTAGDIGTLTFSAAQTVGTTTPILSLASTSVSTFDIAGTGVGNYDVIALNAFSITFKGTLTLNFINGYTPQIGDTFALFTQASELSSTDATIVGTMSGNFSSITSNLGADYSFSFDSATGVLTVSAIPEPASTALLAGLAALLGILVWKRRGTFR